TTTAATKRKASRHGDVGRGSLTLEYLEDRIAPAHVGLKQGVLAVDNLHAGDVVTLRLLPTDPTKVEGLNLGASLRSSARPAANQPPPAGGGGRAPPPSAARYGNPVPTGGVRYDGGGGAGGTLVAPNAANAWTVTGANAGTLNGLVSFLRTPNLVGGSA